MVNRHFLRQKVLQSLYAYCTSGETNIEKQEQFLYDSVFQLYDLEVLLLACLLEIRDIELVRTQEAKNKFFPTEDEKNPNMRFVDNRYFKRLENHLQLQRAMDKQHVNLVNEKDILKKILMKFRQSDAFKEYMSNPINDYEEDRKIVVKLFKNYVIKDENLAGHLCEKGFLWECDYEYVCQVALQWVKTWLEDDNDQKPLPYPFDKNATEEYESDKEFVHTVLYNTATRQQEYEPYINKRIKNWDLERLAYIDVLIIKMAITEFLYCPTIPLRVSLNEYIELAKEFSTQKSGLFVNGILDRVITDLRIENKIHKDEDEALYFEMLEQQPQYNDLEQSTYSTRVCKEDVEDKE